MSQQPSPTPAAPAPAGFPFWLDYLFMLVGCAISLVLSKYTYTRITQTDVTPGWIPDPLIVVLPALLLLPVGIYLWWPVFFIATRFRGRTKDLTVAEWLWGVIWLLDLLLVLVIFWLYMGHVPEMLVDYVDMNMIRDNAGGVLRGLSLCLAGLAIVIALLARLSRTPKSWTHHFALALMMWPLVPMGIIWWARLVVEF